MAEAEKKAEEVADVKEETSDFDFTECETYDISYKAVAGANIKSAADYTEKYNKSINNPKKFWGDLATSHIDWIRPYDNVMSGSFEKGDICWFQNGKLNVSYNCIDRWAKQDAFANKTAILWEGNEPGDVRKISFLELQQEVSRLANVFKSMGIRKGDAVCIYMPMVPEAAYAMLACTRIGAPHSVVFAGFSSDAIRDRCLDANIQYVITADQGVRGKKKPVDLKKIVDKALTELPAVKKVLMYQRTGADVPMTEGRDLIWKDEMAKQRPYCPCEVMDSEDTLFLLYTSGSTGKPKGVVHTTAGYLLYTMLTTRWTFDLQANDVFACVADVGWITGHSYIVYGALANGATTLMFESTPLYPDAGRYWDMVQRHKITQFYTAPTAIRALMKFGNEPVEKYDLSSLRVLGTVGEPINPEAWIWYHEIVGKKTCPIVDTYWQTETGGHMLTPLPAASKLKPGSATGPFFGIKPLLLDAEKGTLIEGNGVTGVLVMAQPWPSMARTVYGDHARYLRTYMEQYPGYYFTGDGAIRDKDGFLWITGRVDDVLNVSGHRLGTAEIESALVTHESCVEAACVGIPHEIKGQAIFAYCVLGQGHEDSDELRKALKNQVRSVIGPFAQPQEVLVVSGVPKTRSGKIMRRILRKIACGEEKQLGDITTLAESSVVQSIIDKKNSVKV